MRLRQSCSFAIGLLLSSLSVAVAQDAAQSLALLDDLEFRIEIGQHERLNKRRTKEGTTLPRFKATAAAATCPQAGRSSARRCRLWRDITAIDPRGRAAALRTIGFTTRAVAPTWMPRPVSRPAGRPTRRCVSASSGRARTGSMH